MDNLAASSLKNSQIKMHLKKISMTSFILEKQLHYCHFKVRITNNEIMGSQSDIFLNACPSIVHRTWGGGGLVNKLGRSRKSPRLQSLIPGKHPFITEQLPLQGSAQSNLPTVKVIRF